MNVYYVCWKLVHYRVYHMDDTSLHSNLIWQDLHINIHETHMTHVHKVHPTRLCHVGLMWVQSAWVWGLLCVHVSCGSHVSAECMSVGCTICTRVMWSAECMSVGCTLCTCDPVTYTKCTHSALTWDPHDMCTQSTYKGGEKQGGSRCWSPPPPSPLPPLFGTILVILQLCGDAPPPTSNDLNSYPPAHSAEQFKIRKDTFEQKI